MSNRLRYWGPPIDGAVQFFCPACQDWHTININPGRSPQWQFNGSFTHPTFSPSILVKTGIYVDKDSYKTRLNPSEHAWYEQNSKICHSFVTDGKIHYCGDCSHPYSNQIIDIPLIHTLNSDTMSHYSQNKEDLFMLDLLKNRPLGEGNFSDRDCIIDIGANDGYTLSNSRLFISTMGWHGIMVEPVPSVLTRLKKLYSGSKKVHILPCAISDLGQDYVNLKVSGSILNSDDEALVSTLSQEDYERFSKATSWTEERVRNLSMDEFNTLLIPLIDKHELKVRILSIDTEGYDLYIMKNFLFDLIRPDIVCVEFNGKNEDRFTEVASEYNYSLMLKNAENLIFA